MTPEKFTSACSVTKTALTETLKETTGLKGKALNKIIDATLDGMTEDKQTAPQIKRA